ncbi:MAG: hypothetical protein NTW86_28760, partial [Candidatus Sumerlaeota bacterium]|nr:hypothetical protein [Candidatus Sumerlaeota bacterium]
MRLSRWIWGVLALGLVLSPSQGFPAMFEKKNHQLILSTPFCRLALSAENGSLLSLEDAHGAGALFQRSGPLWVIERQDAPAIESTAYSAASDECNFACEGNDKDRELRLRYTGPQADVRLTVKVNEDSLDWRAEIQMKEGAALEFVFPKELCFEGENVETLYVPHRLGVGFTKEFFRANLGGWERKTIGPAGFEFLTGDRCQMRPVQDAPVPLRVTAQGQEWLGGEAAAPIARWKARANRCPQNGTFDLCLVESEHGPWLTGYHLGGTGWLFRFGGMLALEDYSRQFLLVSATLAHARGASPDSSAKQIGVISFQRGGEPGAKLASPLARWIADLRKAPWAQKAGLQVVELRGLDALRQALASPAEWFAILNPGAEAFPAESTDRWKD